MLTAGRTRAVLSSRRIRVMLDEGSGIPAVNINRETDIMLTAGRTRAVLSSRRIRVMIGVMIDEGSGIPAVNIISDTHV